MARILTVDDSRAIRSIVAKQVTEIGFEIAEAEDGEQGLAQLAGGQFDLVILDVTMPVLDGLAMLARMRERGDKTPVLMLTSESKRSVISACIKLGVDDYILKPFKPDELRAKIVKVLQLTQPPGSLGLLAAMHHAGDGRLARPRVDLLAVDDMDNVHRKLRQLVPEQLSVDSCTGAQAALAMARERIYRLIVIDLEIPDVDSAVLGSQLRTLQPQASCVALALRHQRDGEAEARRAGFDGIMFKPFDQAQVDECLAQHLDDSGLVTADANLIAVSSYTGPQDRLDRYFRRIQGATSAILETIAAASFQRVIVDLTAAPVRAERTPRLISALNHKSAQMGLELRVVGGNDVKVALAAVKDTSRVPVYDDVLAASAS